LKLNGTHELLFSVVTLMDENKYHKEKNTILSNASKNTGIEVNLEKTFVHVLSPECITKS